MTFSARFKVQDVGEGPAPINVLAVAEVEDGRMCSSIDRAFSVFCVRLVIAADETNIKAGDVITAPGHFVS